MEDDHFLAVILSNLFRKESNGDAIEFFLRRRRLSPNQNNGELDNKLKKLKQQIENCGGCFGEEPRGCHSIELVFPEQIDNIDEVDSDIFKAEYIDECIKCGELLDLEDFRLGKSPYSSININRIMKGHESWDSVSRTSPAKGRKLPDFGPLLQRSPESQKNCVPVKKSRRVEYSIEEDLAILKFLLANNLHDKVRGNTIWKIVHRNFPNHSYHSLHNRFRRFILPNLSKYKGLTNSERKLFSHNVSSDSSTFLPKKTIQTDNRSSINNKTLTTESAITVVDQETVLAPICVLEEVSERNPKKAIKSNADSGLKKEVSSNKLGKTLLLRGFDDSDIEESMTLTPNTLEVVLSNLFRKESNGDAIEFYMQRNRFCHLENSVELEEKYGKLKEQIEKCGGFLGETPTSCHAIELVFPEVVDDTTEIESDVFKAEYVEACLKCGDLRNLEDFRLGTSPYDGSININSIMKGHDSWDSVIRKDLRKGRKLPNLESSSESIKSICSGKKRRNEYSVEEDLAILKFLMLKNLHDKVEGNSIWKIVHNEFPLHSSQSLRNRFRRHILPNLHSYKDLTNTERNLFSRGSSSDDSCTSLSGKTQKSDTSATSHKENQNDVVAVRNISCSEKNPNDLVSTPADFAFPKTVVHESGLSSNVMENCNSVTSAVSLTNGRKTKEKEVGEFTVETDKCVLEYIIRHKRYTEVSEMKLWKDIQKSIFKQRDWKAIKQRFHDVIVKDLESEEYSLDENVIQKFRAKNLSSSSEQNNSSDEDDSSPPSHPKARKAAPRPYTFKEDKLIIDYIVKSERFEEIRGKRLWVDIQDKVLHGYNRTWESAKNRFLRTLFKNLTLYRLNPEIISKFECGAVAERHLGGVNDRRSSRHISTKIKNSRKTEDSDEDVLPKHPALGTEKIATPSKKSKRHLFRQPIIPIPVIFSPQPGPSLPKKKGGSTRVNTPAELEPPAAAPEAAEQLSKSPEVLHTVTTLPMGGLTKTAGATSTESTVSATSFKSQTLPKKLQPAPSLRCSVVLKKLRQTELEKYGCKAVSQQKMFNYSTSAGPSVHPPPTTPPPVSPLKASRFTVEISSDLLAARLSAAGSSVLAVAQANQESGWLPLSSLSGEPIQHSEPLKSSHDTSACTTSHELLDKFQLCSSVTIVSSNVESCSVDDEEHVEAEVPDQVSFSALLKVSNPTQTRVSTHSYLELTKDGLSSDGYRTPEG
ncbi:uncharacterized protein LOC130688185 isoform X2 [Daphnia carinata]|uniref:uncharacterized protein LOC130688185 isoform X2 n=1 Tax=Daphnia carinata TaxID=120202 RepID=UPI002868AE31|nr:uncharacterized protein LOC130688185 isoform X2 [Daphnia carinata]